MPTIDNWRALRDALEAGPTDNEWTLEAVEDHSIKHLCSVDVDGMSILTVVWHDDKPFAAVYLEQDAHYIAAAHPAAIRSLLAERDRLAAENSTMRARLDRAVSAAEEHFGEDAIRYKISLFQNGRARNVFPTELDGRWVAFQRADNDAHIGLCDRINTLAAEVEALRVALRFYATGEHFHIDPDEEWDSVSGEPENWLCSDRENSTTMLENGTVARMVLQGKAIDWTADGEDCTPSIVQNEAPIDAAMKGKP